MREAGIILSTFRSISDHGCAFPAPAVGMTPYKANLKVTPTYPNCLLSSSNTFANNIFY